MRSLIILLCFYALSGCQQQAAIKKDGGVVSESTDDLKADCSAKKNGEACLILGQRYASGNGVEQSFSRSLSLYLDGCKYGEPRACYGAGLFFQFGKSVDVDLNKTQHYFEQACKDVLRVACHDLALLYLGAESKQIARGKTLLADNCEADFAPSCVTMSKRLLQDPLSNREKISEAQRLASKACDAQSGEGCHILGLIEKSHTGEGAQEQAASAFNTACALGYPLSCFYLAEQYEKGLGVPADFNRARALRISACERNNLSAQERRTYCHQ